MQISLYLRTLILSVLGALGISLISLFSLSRIADVVVEDYRYGHLLGIARAIERSAFQKPIEKVNLSKLPAPSVSEEETPKLVKVTEGEHHPERGPRSTLWLVSESGKVLSGNTKTDLPVEWKELPRPGKVHELKGNQDRLLRPRTFVMRLATTPATYLVSHNERSLFQGAFLWVQGIHAFLTAALAVILALSMSFFYLRRKSAVARKVLQRLENGDLKARFEVRPFDGFGNLILDFNRMADHIERLVKRVRDTETSRSHLLQELGHDLRTPMTSLRTSFETLKHLNHALSAEDREELFYMIDADVTYFQDLLEKLTIIATIDEPNYRKDSQRIDLTTLLEEEIRNRQLSSGQQLTWKLDVATDAAVISGDVHLITRLIKNAFDNASRYAGQLVQVHLKKDKEKIELEIRDDGPGLTAEALASFGKRRERRQLKERDVRSFSTGLGSVIMKTIAEVHQGSVSINNRLQGEKIAGAALVITLRSA